MFRWPFRKFRQDDLAREIESHLELETAEQQESGVAREEAHYAARRVLGNRTLLEEEIHHMGRSVLLDSIVQDLRYAVRTLRKNRGFALTAILMLALGIGANTAIFTVVRAVLLKPLAYRDPDRLVRLSGGATLAHYEQLRTTAGSFAEVGAYCGGVENLSLSGSSDPEVLKGARVSANFLSILGVAPVLGRSFTPGEDTPGGPAVAMISYGLWKRRFGGDSSISGTTVNLDAAPYTIIGVLPPGFAFPFPDVDAWLTRPDEWSIVAPKSRPLSPILGVFARLKPGADLKQASAELIVLNHQYAMAHPAMLDAKPKTITHVTPLKEELVSNVQSKLWMLFGAVAFVLLIACANIASLLLARAASRSHELAVRAAIGAGRGRLIRQLLIESLLLALSGGALGLLLAKWSLSGISHLAVLNLPRAGEIRLDAGVLGFTLVLSIVTGILFGLAPSLGASRPNLARVLKATGESRATTDPRRFFRGLSAQGLLVVAQVALSLVLLIGATLLMETMAHLRGIDPGFRVNNLLTMQIPLPPARYGTDEKRAAFYQELTSRVEALPGIHGAAVALTLPMTGYVGSPVQVVGRPSVRLNERPIAIVEMITPSYFKVMNVVLKRGRAFTVRDNAGGTAVAVIDESLARTFWPGYPSGPNPIGQRINIGAHAEPIEIAGIVADVHQEGPEENRWPEVYLPSAQSPPSSAMVVARTEGDPLQFVNSIRNQVREIDRDQAISQVKTMDDIVEASEGQQRLMMTLLSLFAIVAAMLAVIGIYGVIAYSVLQRTREIGIRQALGARRNDILWLVAGKGLALTSVGVLLGVGGSLALTRVLQGLLFQVSATDFATFAGVSLSFVIVGLAASYLPALRAARIDPLAAVRGE